jgi:hypothetical protein
MANGTQGYELPESVRTGLNNTGSTIAKGTIVKLTATGGLEVAPAAAATDAFYGVAGEDIANGARGRVVTRGVALVLASAALTIGGRVTSTAAGLGVNAAAGNAVLGIALEAGAASTLTMVELCGPGGQQIN